MAAKYDQGYLISWTGTATTVPVTLKKNDLYKGYLIHLLGVNEHLLNFPLCQAERWAHLTMDT